MLSLIAILISSFIIIGIAIFYFKATPEQRLKMLPSAGLDEITPSEQQAIERGELKVEPLKKVSWLYALSLLIFWFVKGWIDVKTHDCTLIFNWNGQLVANLWWGFLVLVLLMYSLVDLYQNYTKAIQTGFLPKLQITNSRYQFYYKANLPKIKINYSLKTVGMLLLFIFCSWIFLNGLGDILEKVDMSVYPKTQLSTYQIASEKLQQQCLAKKKQ